jgi:hypothetical protein
MPSPFPGMNPYLEHNDVWEDFHDRFLVFLASDLERQVGPNYLVKIEARLYLRELDEEERRFFGKADLGVSEGGEPGARAAPSGAPGSATATMTAPLVLPLELPRVDVERDPYLEIRDRRDRHLVTVIELLSPTNKTRGPDRDDYLRKRKQVLYGSAHFVEIDLLRGGLRPEPPDFPTADYYVLVSRATERSNAYWWRLELSDRLPVFPVPLTAPDADVLVDLQNVLHRTYDEAGYGKYIYDEQPQPPLSAEDAAWARTILDGSQRVASAT